MRILWSVALGAGFGALVSTVNALSPRAPGLRFTSLLLDAGWAWAALAVAVGWLAAGWALAAVAGASALVAATAVYYLADAVHRAEPFTTYGPELGSWCAAGLVLGSVLGLVGATARRPDLVGLLARLTVPAGAALQMAVLPPGTSGATVPADALWARAVVWAAAAVAAVLVVAPFVRAAAGRRRV